MKESLPWKDRKPLAEHEREANWDRVIVGELETPLYSVLLQLREGIDQGYYRVVIGDDASGRIPTLIVSKVIGALYARQGREKPLVRFIAGSTDLEEGPELDLKRAALGEHIARIATESGIGTKGEKVLIVTDTVASGVSVGFLVDVLRAKGLEADVATVTLTEAESVEDIKDRKSLIGAPVAWGTDKIPMVYGEENISGVTKEPERLFAEPTVLDSQYPDKVQFRVNAARKVVDEVAEHLVQRLLKGDELQTQKAA